MPHRARGDEGRGRTTPAVTTTAVIPDAVQHGVMHC